MSNIKVQKVSVSYQGVGKLLKSKEMQGGLQDLAAGIARRAGSGYASDTKMMGTRVIASAYTEDEAAMRDSLENNTLLKAVQG